MGKAWFKMLFGVKMSIIDHYVDYIRFFLHFFFISKSNITSETSNLNRTKGTRHGAVCNFELSEDRILPVTFFNSTLITLKLC